MSAAPKFDEGRLAQVLVAPIVSEKATRVGVARFCVSPIPNCPTSFFPQQYTRPVFGAPHVVSFPAAIEVKTTVELTATGDKLLFIAKPAPSWPYALEPQQ